MPGQVAVIRVINQASYSCFLTFLQVVVEKLMKVKSAMVSSLASGKYECFHQQVNWAAFFFSIGEVV